MYGLESFLQDRGFDDEGLRKKLDVLVPAKEQRGNRDMAKYFLEGFQLSIFGGALPDGQLTFRDRIQGLGYEFGGLVADETLALHDRGDFEVDDEIGIYFDLALDAVTRTLIIYTGGEEAARTFFAQARREMES